MDSSLFIVEVISEKTECQNLFGIGRDQLWGTCGWNSILHQLKINISNYNVTDILNWKELGFGFHS